MANVFAETRNLYITYTGYIKPLSYEEWCKVPDSHKAAVLFVQFYDEITLAWNKTKSFYTLEEDGVSTMNQYLMKNVPILLENPKRFTSSYIYKVAYNCLYCICHDIKRDRARWENEVSNIVESDGDELDLFDTVSVYSLSASDVLFTECEKAQFWDTIANMGPKAQKVVNHLLNGESLQKASKKARSLDPTNPLNDISVSLAEVEDIIKDLRLQLSRYQHNM